MTHDAKGYSERIQRVVDYLAEHLDETLDLEVLARVAYLSPYHFHRIYRGLLGETVNDTVRRLRLRRSAIDLLDRDSEHRTRGPDGPAMAVKRRLRARFARNTASRPRAIAALGA